jgi:tripartite-type tricarboxylate transporter receptor subunit TctC
MGRRVFIAALATAGLSVTVAGGALAQEFPDKGLTLIVAYGAGGGTDVTARLLASDLEETIGQPVTVQNITGGGGWNGWGAIADAEPHGYTIGYINIPNMYAGYLDPNIGRDETLESFTPLMNHVTDYCVWAVRPDSPYQTIDDLIEAAKADPEGISITAHGHGNDDHLAILAVERDSDVDFSVVHNQSTADSKAQVLGGHVDVLGGNVSEVAADVEAGDLRILGVMARERSQFLPDSPHSSNRDMNRSGPCRAALPLRAGCRRTSRPSLSATSRRRSRPTGIASRQKSSASRPRSSRARSTSSFSRRRSRTSRS